MQQIGGHTISLTTGSDLHFGPFERIPGASPAVPDDALPVRRHSRGYVTSVQVTPVTGVEPPGASILLSTVTAILRILVLVPSRESLTILVLPAYSGIGKAVT